MGKKVEILKIKDPELYRLMNSFLTTYLPNTRQKSEHTVQAYKDVLNLYVTFITENKSIRFNDIRATDFNQENISAFLDWLKKARGNESTTINQRLSHIKGFCKYIMKKDILSFTVYGKICEIAEYKDNRKQDFIWLTVDEVKLVLKQPDTNKRTGARDKFFIALMYESGCRDDEILHLKLKDIVVNKEGEPDVHIFGKGNKHRCTPLSKNIVPYFDEYCKLYHPDIRTNNKDELLFYTVRNGIKTQMSQDNVQRFMNVYEKKAKAEKTDLPHIHPHLWRRTRAMHLYLAGVPLPLVSEWLGHSSMESTRIYARATDEMKRQAQRKLGEKEGSVFSDDVAFKYADNEEVLKRLAGLK
jgi:integrase/recombinase XerD